MASATKSSSYIRSTTPQWRPDWSHAPLARFLFALACGYSFVLWDAFVCVCVRVSVCLCVRRCVNACGRVGIATLRESSWPCPVSLSRHLLLA